jgi:lipid-A-disaccharide synthase
MTGTAQEAAPARPGFQVMILAGEASGDMKGGGLVEAVRRASPAVRFWGAGGRRMREAGVEILFDSAMLSVNGLVEAMVHARQIWYIYRRLREALRARRPALVVLIDFPDFNLFFARQVRVSRMMVVFPFEVPLYREHGLPVDFVGHPLIDLARPRLPREETLRKLDLDPGRPLIALLPGSRRSELRNIYPTLLRAAEVMAAKRPDLQFATPVASTLGMQAVAAQTRAAGVPVALAENLTYEVVAAADAAAVAAGTATLECALLGTPMIMVYRVSPITYLLRPIVSLEHYCLVNVLANRAVVPELIQKEYTAERVAAAMLPLLGPEGAAQRKAFAEVRAGLGEEGASARAAEVLLAMLSEPPGAEARA